MSHRLILKKKTFGLCFILFTQMMTLRKIPMTCPSKHVENSLLFLILQSDLSVFEAPLKCGHFARLVASAAMADVRSGAFPCGPASSELHTHHARFGAKHPFLK